MDRRLLRARYLELTRETLPARARADGWPLRFDHCFQRVALDNAVGDRWYDAVPGRPAIDHLTDAQLAAAVAVAERIAREGVPLLEELDANSLRWRSKRPKRFPSAPAR